jgi:MFS family permease
VPPLPLAIIPRPHADPDTARPLTADAPPPGRSLRAVLAHAGFTRFLVARFAGSFASQMQTVAIGMQVYQLTHSNLDLGLIELSQVVPFLLFVLVAGQAADRLSRKHIVGACFVLQLACSVALAALTHAGLASPWPVFAVMALFGVARAAMAPASQALMPNLVPAAIFGNAVGLNSGLWQVATIAGPALGGVLYAAAGPGAVYVAVTVLLAVAVGATASIEAPAQEPPGEPASWHTLVEGVRFVWRRHSLLGAISLDLFAVLFGGATALLPAYATDVLGVGVTGLGWLRAAPGMGAAVMAAVLTLWPINRRAGRAMFAGVAVFGVATIVFGLSHSFALSLVALAVLGAADMVSVFVRHLLVQLETPDAMRGRVGAVSWMFIGASNELGGFESGLTAAWWGLVPAVVVGGGATLAVAWAWTRWFPELRRLDRFPGS